MTQQNSIFTKGKLNNSVDELIKNYKNFLEHPKIIPDEKIIFSPLIKKIIDDVNKTYQSNIYNVLFVLLSGNIDKKDYKEIINSMILSSYLPLSIIVIGIGNHDFSKYKELFNLDNKYSSENMPKNKDKLEQHAGVRSEDPVLCGSGPTVQPGDGQRSAACAGR